MGILNIRPAVRAGSKVVIGIAGPSGSGKTRTALEIARGMVIDPSKIGFLDAENRRGSLYADVLDGPFMIGDLYPPFSPKRYSDAIKEFQNHGVEVLIIDSVTHEWEGEGGCVEIAEANGAKVPRWNIAKPEHKKFMNTLLQSDMHIICCIRAREKVDMSNPRNIINLGMQPITEKNFMFEMTTSMMMYDAGTRQEFIKTLPDDLKGAFGEGKGYIGQDTGRAIINWVNSGDNTDIDLEKYKSVMQMACSDGLAALTDAYKSLPTDIQKRMLPLMGPYKSSAVAFDEHNTTEQEVLDNVQSELAPPPVQQQSQQSASDRKDI